MVSPFQFAVRMNGAEEGLRGLWPTQEGCGFGTVGDGETPLAWMGQKAGQNALFFLQGWLRGSVLPDERS